MNIGLIRKSIITATLILFVLLSSGAFVQSHGGAKEKNFLWKVRSKNSTLYLAGSVHLLKKDDYPLDESFEKAYQDSKKVFFEINLDTADQGKIQQVTFTKGMYQGGPKLKDKIRKETYEKTKEGLSSLGLNIEQFHQFKPWLLGISITVFKLQSLGYDPNQGVDKYFYRKAKADGKAIGGFETAEYQMDLLGGMDDALQEQLLLQSLKELANMEAYVGVFVDAWKTGDTKTLETQSMKSYAEFPEIHDILLTQRNKNWMPKIDRLSKLNENTMIIVGAAHLVGKDGIIAALQTKGYTVEQW